MVVESDSEKTPDELEQEKEYELEREERVNKFQALVCLKISTS
jgi:hypothetical protein